MKKIVALCTCLFLFLTVFIIYLSVNSSYVDVNKYQEDTGKRLIEYLDNSDSNSIKGMYCTKTKSECENLDEQIEQLNSILGNNIDSFGEIRESGESKSIRKRKITKLGCSFTIENVCLRDGQECSITISSDIVNTEHPECVGIEIIGVHYQDKSKDFYIGD